MLFVIEDIGSRNYQEDRHHVIFDFYKDFDYFAVFDGHGDDKVSTFLKLYFAEILKSELLLEEEPLIEKRILNAFARLNKLLPKNIAMHAGSTALVMIKNDYMMYVANVGDSRAVINNGQDAVSITTDHKPDTDKEKQRIVKDGGFVVYDPVGIPRVNGTLAMSRAVGDFYLHPFVSWVPDIFTVKLGKSNTFVVAASDGLWDVLSNQQVVDMVNSGLKQNDLNIDPKKTLNIITRKLLKEARIRGSGDNTTILLLIL